MKSGAMSAVNRSAMTRLPTAMKNLLSSDASFLCRQPDDLARIHDVQRVDSALDGPHHVEGRSKLALQESDLPLSDSVLPRASAVHGDGALRQPRNHLLGAFHLRRVGRVDE